MFLIINTWIVLADIRERKIPNILLLILVGILPFWYIWFPISNSIQMIIWALLSLILVWFGVFAYKKNGFLGSGDIKYAAIITLYIGGHPLSIWLGNIWAITLVTLVCWLTMIIGQATALRRYIDWEDYKKAIGDTSRQAILSWIKRTILDWIIIGFFFSLILKDTYTIIFDTIPRDTDFYFFLTLIIFLMRPHIRYMLTQWSYRIWPTIGMILYFGYHIQQNGANIFFTEHKSYLFSIWQYAIIFILLQKIVTIVFYIYDTIITTAKIQSSLQTVPYSLVIFIAFIVTNWWSHINLMSLLKFILSY